MKTPKKSAIEIDIVRKIRVRLALNRRSKRWLATELGMDYGKVKRILDRKCEQQLSLSVADKMLVLLGSSLRDTLLLPIIKELRKDIEASFDKFGGSR